MDTNWTTRVRLCWSVSHETEADLTCKSPANEDKGGLSSDEKDMYNPQQPKAAMNKHVLSTVRRMVLA